MAGRPAGETIRDPEGTSAGSLLGGDIAHINKQLDRLAGENERKRDRLVAKADQQVAGQFARPEVWAAVQVVAAKLRKPRYLSGDAVEGLIAAHVPAALRWLAQP